MNPICRLLQNRRLEAGLFRDSSHPLPSGRQSYSRQSPVLFQAATSPLPSCRQSSSQWSPVLPIRLIRPIGPILPFCLL